MILKPRLFRKPRLRHPLARGLVGLWLMNEGAGTKIFDLSGNGNTGTFVTGVTWTAGKSGSATDHTSDGARLEVPDSDLFSFAGDKPFSIFIRFNMTANDGVSDINFLFTKDGCEGGAWKREWSLAVDTGVLTFGCYEIDNADSIGRKGGSVSTGIWYDAIITYDGSKNRTGIKIYQDGVRVDDTDSGSATYAGMTAGSRVVGIGTWVYNNDYSSYDWNGLIEFAGIYNRKLSASEAAQLYREPFCMFERDPIELWSAATLGVAPPVGMAGAMTTNTGYWGY